MSQERAQNAFEGELEEMKVVQQKNACIFNHLSAMVNFNYPYKQSERGK